MCLSRYDLGHWSWSWTRSCHILGTG